MSRKTRPTQVDEEVYNEFKKYCIDNDLELSETLEKAIREFLKG